MLYNFLKNYTSSGIYPFHMPGHKRNRVFLPENLLDFDITEIPGADNLNAPEGIILQFQQFLSEIYGSDESILLINGSSSGILAALLYASDNPVIMARNAHRSAYQSLILSGAEPSYIYPEMTEYGIAGGNTPESVLNAIRANPLAGAVFITSPTFEGFVSDIEKIADIIHSYNKILIVDEAHGAHFAFSDFFPKSSLALGADIVIHSLHKTLPVLGQMSVMHIKGGGINRQRLKQFVSFVQTSSPSYLLMAQTDYAIEKLVREPEVVDKYIEMLTGFYNNAASLKKISIAGMKDKSKSGIFDFDLSKLIFFLHKTQLNGNDFEKILLERYKIQLEMSGLNHSVCLTSPADSECGFERLFKAVYEIDCECKHSHFDYNISANKLELAEEIAMTPKAAFNSRKKPVPLELAELKISGGFVIPYPPGIPLLVPGERITSKLLEKIRLYNENNIPLIGSPQGIIDIVTQERILNE